MQRFRRPERPVVRNGAADSRPALPVDPRVRRTGLCIRLVGTADCLDIHNLRYMLGVVVLNNFNMSDGVVFSQKKKHDLVAGAVWG